MMDVVTVPPDNAELSLPHAAGNIQEIGPNSLAAALRSKGPGHRLKQRIIATRAQMSAVSEANRCSRISTQFLSNFGIIAGISEQPVTDPTVWNSSHPLLNHP